MELHATQDRRIVSFGPGGEAANGCTYTRSRTAANAGGGRDDVPSRPEDRDPLGQGRQADVDPDPRRAQPGPGEGRPRAARRHSAAAFRVTAAAFAWLCFAPGGQLTAGRTARGGSLTVGRGVGPGGLNATQGRVSPAGVSGAASRGRALPG